MLVASQLRCVPGDWQVLVTGGGNALVTKPIKGEHCPSEQMERKAKYILKQ